MTATQKNRWGFAACLCLLLALLAFGNETTGAVRQALRLCAETVIPSLFPFLVLSGLLTAVIGGIKLPGARLFRRLFHLPEVGLSAFLLGAPCGFPIGAKTAAELCLSGAITREEAARLAALSANTGPAFAVLAVGMGLFRDLRLGLLFYIAQLAAAILLALPEAQQEKRRGTPLSSRRPTETKKASLPDVLYRSSLTMLTVTGTVLFFASVTSVLSLLLPPPAAALLAACLEVGNGSAAAAALPLPLGIPLGAFAISFSGSSVLMQSAAELSPLGIPLGPFIRRKLYQGLLATGIALLSLPFLV